MSHLTTIQVEFKDLAALKVACTELGLELVEGQKSFKWYTTVGACDHAIRIPRNRNAYECGLVAKGDSFELKFDTYMGGNGMMAKIGENAAKLKQAYTVEVTRKTMMRKGYRCQKVQRENGIRLILTK